MNHIIQNGFSTGGCIAQMNEETTKKLMGVFQHVYDNSSLVTVWVQIFVIVQMTSVSILLMVFQLTNPIYYQSIMNYLKLDTPNNIQFTLENINIISSNCNLDPIQQQHVNVRNLVLSGIELTTSN
ncbi:hypothetical protein ACTFIU_009401 [Dictyostelium citrinum]